MRFILAVEINCWTIQRARIRLVATLPSIAQINKIEPDKRRRVRLLVNGQGRL
jgi:hypothetical protein